MAFRYEHASTSHKVYRDLRERILSLTLEPRVPLGEQSLAAEMNVSRTPVREALGRLSADGLVEIIPNKGAMVAPIRTAAVLTAQFVREVLEVAVAREAASRIDPRGLFELRQAIEEQNQAEREGAAELFYRADERMHRIITGIAGRPMVWTLIEEAKIHMDRARKFSLVETSSFADLITQHEAIVDALEERDADAVDAGMRQHLRTILPDLQRLKSDHPDFFDDDEAVADANTSVQRFA